MTRRRRIPLSPEALLRMLRPPSQLIKRKDWQHDPERVSAAQAKRERRQARNLRTMGVATRDSSFGADTTDRRARPRHEEHAS